jgi:hypothetical protein
MLPLLSSALLVTQRQTGSVRQLQKVDINKAALLMRPWPFLKNDLHNRPQITDLTD